MKVKYCGPARDYSGYGEANRHDIAALVAAEVLVTTQIPQYTLELSDFGPLGAIATEREDKPLGYKVKILHTTPNVYRQYMEPGKYHVGRVFWETNKLPLDFSSKVQLMDEVWTGSQYNKDAIRNAGVTVPIYIIPEAIDTEIPKVRPYLIPHDKDYKFYSVFEWTNRKNPAALLEAFWLEFENTKGVSLTLKTYIDNFTSHKRDEIKSYIKRVKKRLRLTKYAPVYMFNSLMDRIQVYRFHKTFDCYVSPHRGEGWGIPQMEALLSENAVISTNCGGVHEYLRHKKDAWLLPYKLIDLKDPIRNPRWYTKDQKWADVKVDDLRKAMRWCFENQEDARAMGKCGKLVVKRKFNLKTVGRKMLKRLLKIREKLQPRVEE